MNVCLNKIDIHYEIFRENYSNIKRFKKKKIVSLLLVV